MVLLDRKRSFLSTVSRMATCAVILVVASGARQTKTIYVLPMPENNDRVHPLFGSGPINFRLRFSDGTVHSPQDIVSGWSCRIANSRTDGPSSVTNPAVRGIDPVLMTIKTLPVIGAFKARLINPRAFDTDIMTGFACRVLLTFGRVVMAKDTPPCHFSHVRVALMVKRHRQICLLQFVEYYDVRPRLSAHVQTRVAFTQRQTGFLNCRKTTCMAARATGVALVGPHRIDRRLCTKYRRLL